MKFLNRDSKKDSENVSYTLKSVAFGRVIPLNEVDDPAFSGGLLGEGYALVPEAAESGKSDIFSPTDGKVLEISDTLHAYTIRTECGADLLIHIGIDTVTLGGRGFSASVKAGESVRAGQIIASADTACIREKGLDPVIMVVITNPEDFDIDRDITPTDSKGGETDVLTFRVKR